MLYCIAFYNTVFRFMLEINFYLLTVVVYSESERGLMVIPQSFFPVAGDSGADEVTRSGAGRLR